METFPQLSGAIDGAQDALMGFGVWGEALQRVVEALGATSGLLIPPGIARARLFEMQQESAAHLAFSDVWHRNMPYPGADPHMDRPRRVAGRGGAVLIEDDITTAEERTAMPYYRAVAAPGDRVGWGMIRLRTRAGRWCMPLYRNRARGPFGEQDARRLLGAVPAITRLIAGGEMMAQARVRARIEGIEDLGRAAFALRQDGGVICGNAAAGRLEGPDLWISGGRLRAAEAGNAARLAGFVARATVMAGACDPVILHREGRPWMVADAMPVTERMVSVFSGAAVLVVLSPVDHAGVAPVPVLRAAFGLTPAEARLAQELARGVGLADAALVLGIGRETARSHLEALFDKTGCRRQAALSAVLARVGLALGR